MIFSVLIFRFQLLNIRGVFHAYVFFFVYDDPVDKDSFCCDLGCIFGEDVHTKACV